MPSWLEYVISIMESFDGGVATFAQIYDKIESDGERNDPEKSWKSRPRDTIQAHCSTSKMYSGRGDYFYKVAPGKYGIRKLRPVKTEEQIHEDYVLTPIRRRRGQGKFRDSLLKVYNNSCAISDVSEPSVLEACHIIPYTGTHSNSISNGIILRADLHTLFDLNLLKINSNHEVEIDPIIKDKKYRSLHGNSIFLPTKVSDRPDKNALKTRSSKPPVKLEVDE